MVLAGKNPLVAITGIVIFVWEEQIVDLFPCLSVESCSDWTFYGRHRQVPRQYCASLCSLGQYAHHNSFFFTVAWAHPINPVYIRIRDCLGFIASLPPSSS
jgi:hypothetical protein